MKTLKQLREEYDIVSLNQVQYVPDELMLEGRENSVIKSSDRAVPSPTVMPAMLLFRRVAYRQYPNKQVVALYYSKLVNKYLSVPFGPDGNLNLSEAVVLDNIDEGVLSTIAKPTLAGHVAGTALGGVPGAVVGTLGGFGYGVTKAIKNARKDKANKMDKKLEESEVWTRKEGQNPEGGLNRRGVEAYNRKHGAHLQTAVTTKPSKLKPGSKSANRRKSFCARMGGMKKRLTSAKTARDPDSRINKALRKWNCEESFRAKLQEKRQERLDEFANLVVPLLTGAARLAAGTAAGEMAYQGVKRVAKSILSKGKNIASKIPGKSVAKDVASAAVTSAVKDNILSRVGGAPSGAQDDGAIETHKGGLVRNKPDSKSSSSWKGASSSDRTFDSQYKASIKKDFNKPVNENKISDIENMLNEGVETMDLSINGRTVTLNNSMAKKIIRVYESVNTKNKKIVESMLNEDLDSFKKLLNFSIKA